jgi:hypothetical protein
VTIPLAFREHGTTAWRGGTTINASHSGLLFRADGPAPGTARGLDLILTLSLDGVAPPVHVRSSGRVVRTQSAPPPFGGHVVAVFLDGCDSGRGVRVDRRQAETSVSPESAKPAVPRHSDPRDLRFIARAQRMADIGPKSTAKSHEAEIVQERPAGGGSREKGDGRDHGDSEDSSEGRSGER